MIHKIMIVMEVLIKKFFNEHSSNKKIEEDKTIPFLCCFSKS